MKKLSKLDVSKRIGVKMKTPEDSHVHVIEFPTTKNLDSTIYKDSLTSLFTPEEIVNQATK